MCDRGRRSPTPFFHVFMDILSLCGQIKRQMAKICNSCQDLLQIKCVNVMVKAEDKILIEKSS